MDRYFKNKRNCVLTQKELHEIGTTCMFIASKFEDVRPLFLDTVIEKITHGKMRKSEIIKRELDIMTVLNFEIHCLTPLDILDALTTDF